MIVIKIFTCCDSEPPQKKKYVKVIFREKDTIYLDNTTNSDSGIGSGFSLLLLCSLLSIFHRGK